MQVQSYRQQAGVKVQVLENLAAVAQVAARQFVARAKAAVAANDRFTVALSGGSTPKAMFKELLTYDDVPWEKIFVFWGDDRTVPPTHPESNYGMAKEHLLDHVPVPSAHVYRILTEQPPEVAARNYELTLRRYFNLSADGLPRFDLVLLGMGDDGHTASLFPGTKALGDATHLVAANHVEKLHTDRLTFTYPVINSAAWVLVLISGAGKQAAAKAVLETPPAVAELPMQGVHPVHGELLWLIDQAAAGA